MAERDEPQINFRVREEAAKNAFDRALEKQHHIPSAAAFFQSAMRALTDCSESGKLIEWPVELVTKKKK